MSEVERRQRVASEEQRGGRRGQEVRTIPLNRASWSTVKKTDAFIFRLTKPKKSAQSDQSLRCPHG